MLEVAGIQYSVGDRLVLSDSVIADKLRHASVEEEPHRRILRAADWGGYLEHLLVKIGCMVSKA